MRNAKDNPSGMPADTHRIGNLRFKVRNTTALCNMITTNLNKHIKRSDYMSRIPTEGMRKAFEKINTEHLAYRRFNDNHVLEHHHDILTDIDVWDYIHYGVLVGRVQINNETKQKKVELSNYGWSATDRDNFNGLLKLLNIYRVVCFKHYDELYLTTGNKREQLKEVVL